MRRGKKIALLTAGILIVLGAILGTGAVLLGDMDVSSMNNVKIVEGTFLVEEEFHNISVDTDACDVSLLPAPDGIAQVVCWYPDGDMAFDVQVEGDTLTIASKDSRTKWYEMIQFGFGSAWGELEMAVYLPESQYEDLIITSGAGNLNIPGEFSFDTAFLVTASGDVTFRGEAEQMLTLQTASGDILVENVWAEHLQATTSSGTVDLSSLEVRESIDLETSSGDLILSQVECGTLTAHTASGAFHGQDVTAQGSIVVETASGDMALWSCDAADLDLTSSSGDISGSLRSEKKFHADSSSGEVDVPSFTTGGPCEITTSSGNIRFTVEGVQGFGGSSEQGTMT